MSDLTGLDNVTFIGGNINICGNNSLKSLTGLENVTSIENHLVILENDALTSLTGLDNVASIEGDLSIAHHAALTSLIGLENLAFIGGDLGIGATTALTSLTGLNNVTSIGGHLRIGYNDALISLTGLDNIEANTITELTIDNNYSLSNCAVQSICDYLVAPNGEVVISNNATGCNSPEEVEEACETVSVHELISSESFNISPNPLESTAVIKYNLTLDSKVSVKIFNISGQQIQSLVNEMRNRGEQSVTFHTDRLKPGIYFCTLETNKRMATRKLIKLE